MENSTFDPNAPAISSNIYGLPFTKENCNIVIIGIPWDVTTSFEDGTRFGPQNILEASYQVDLFDSNAKDAWKAGLYLEPISQDILNKAQILREKAKKYIHCLENDLPITPEIDESRKLINTEQEHLKNQLKEKALQHFNLQKIPVVIGGDHSTPLGLMEAVSETVTDFSILQIDAHYDLRKAYEGFNQSHASIMYNASKIKNCKTITHVGIRDFCEEEWNESQQNGKSISFLDEHLKSRLFDGENWKSICNDIVNSIESKNVYLSFDIDGLTPDLCPGTGTPVPGGLTFEQAIYLIKSLIESNKRLISFDLSEVSASDDRNWDGNVGARVLFKICNLLAKSNGIIS